MKPATSLPWKSLMPLEYDRAHLRQPNQDYVLHAVNAYPKLVEALKDSIATTPPDSPFLAPRVALLRELGEL